LHRKILALVLCLVLLAAALPVTAGAATNDRKIRENIAADYANALADSDRDTLAGYCGLFASYQLYFRGINPWLRTANGNDHYNIYSAMRATESGYRTKAYSGVDFSMKDALNAVTRHGTQDVYNLLVCFEWTSTEAGNKYGHVVFIYAIIDGIMYFTESFASSMNEKAGDPIAIPIDAFVDYYDDWTRFEGIVVFGQKSYVENCTVFSTNLFLEATGAPDLLSLPCGLKSAEAECSRLRTVATGERLHATALMLNPLGQYYYRVNDGEQIGYVAADKVRVFRLNTEDVKLSDPVAPEVLKPGKDFTVSGEVTAPISGVNTVLVQVLDENGELALGCARTAYGTSSLAYGGYNALLDFSVLPEGYYTYNIYADIANYYLMDDGTRSSYSNRLCLYSSPFRVGDLPEKEVAEAAVQPKMAKNGWVYENETWYVYENDVPRTGWYRYSGVDYYLNEDGSVTTGQSEINGKLRYFTATGAMRTGWVESLDGRLYLLRNGTAARGWHTVEGSRYCFSEDGILQTAGWVSLDEQRYYLLPDGSAATGWQELPDGKFFFGSDGHLIAQLMEDGDSTWLQPYGRMAETAVDSLAK